MLIKHSAFKHTYRALAFPYIVQIHQTIPLILHRFGIYRQSSAYIHHGSHSRNTPRRAASNVSDRTRCKVSTGEQRPQERWRRRSSTSFFFLLSASTLSSLVALCATLTWLKLAQGGVSGRWRLGREARTGCRATFGTFCRAGRCTAAGACRGAGKGRR
jgi:hypothetical protein